MSLPPSDAGEELVARLEHPPPVLSKAEFVRRYQAHEFGNRSPTWGTLEELVTSGYAGLIHLRNRTAGGATYYDLTPARAAALWSSLPNGSWYASAMAPTAETLIQGEVQQAVMGCGRCGLDLYYSTVVKPMRAALAEEAAQVWGVTALLLLRRYLCFNSLEWLGELVRRYPEHVIEFSTYRRPWGTLYPRYNTVFWEVRGGY